MEVSVSEVQAGHKKLAWPCPRQALDPFSLPMPVMHFRRPGLPACHILRPAWPACFGLCIFLHVNIMMIFRQKSKAVLKKKETSKSQ